MVPQTKEWFFSRWWFLVELQSLLKNPLRTFIPLCVGSGHLLRTPPDHATFLTHHHGCVYFPPSAPGGFRVKYLALDWFPSSSHGAGCSAEYLKHGTAHQILRARLWRIIYSHQNFSPVWTSCETSLYPLIDVLTCEYTPWTCSFIMKCAR